MKYSELKKKFSTQTNQMFTRFVKLSFYVLAEKRWPFFFCFFASHSCLIVSSITFVYGFWCKWEFALLMEAIAVAVFYVREILNLLLMLKNAVALKPLIELVVKSRKTAMLEEAQRPLTEDYRRKENYFLMSYAVFLSFAIFPIGCLSVLLQKNEFHLPLNYYMLVFPYDKVISLNWLLNYLHQFIAIFLGGLFFGFNFSLTMLILNQSCWLIDSTFVQVNELDETLHNRSDETNTARSLRRVAEMIENIIDWLKKTQEVFEINFLCEVTLLSILLCIFAFKITHDSSGSFIEMLAVIYMLTQFFVYCWMGSHVTGRLESLSHALQGVGWDQMKPKDRKDLKLMIMIVQNIKGYHGIFKPIDLPTFEDIIKSTYSLLAVLTSSK